MTAPAKATKPINSRQKGAGGEREFSRLVLEHLGVELRRNLEQSRAGGHDLMPVGTDPVSRALDAYALEVKRYRQISPAMLARFWEQAQNQADRVGKIPTLAYREDRQEWRLVVPLRAINREVFGEWLGIDWTCTLSVPAFVCLIRESIEPNSPEFEGIGNHRQG